MFIAFLCSAHKTESIIIEYNKTLEKLAGMEKENEQLSLRLGDYPHMRTEEHEL